MSNKNVVYFLCLELLGAFMILTYEDAVDLFGHVITPTHTFDLILQDILIPWVWILAAFYFVAQGIYQLQSGKYR